MPEFLELLPPPEALARLLANLHTAPVAEEMDTQSTSGRVSFAAVTAGQPLPAFPRTTVDGFAVRATDTFGASESLPAYVQMVGEVPMGAALGMALGAGQCALVHTGGMLPEGADAVVMVEHTQSARSGEVEVSKAVAPGENVLKVGEDVAAGQVVIPAGKLLRPADIGGLMALGQVRIRVARKPRLGLISTGDEVVSPQQEPGPAQVRDVNTYSLGALIQEAGGEAPSYGIVPDRLEALQSSARDALRECDALVITAGSSASVRDLTAQAIGSLGGPGVLVHGVNVRPGKPTILAVCDGKPVFGLPGNPVSALVIASIFITPVIHRLLGLPEEAFRPVVRARLAINLASQAGREDWIPVRLQPAEGGMQAEPVFGKSNLIFSLARADGLVCIPADATGLAAGEIVDVVPL